MATASSALDVRRARSALPGSDRLDELVHLLRDPTAFLHARFQRHGRLWKTRFVFPAVFAVGDEANRTMLVTRRGDFAQGLGYARTPVRWVFAGSIMLQDGDEHVRTRELLTPAVGKLAIRDARAQVQAIWDRRAEALADCCEDVYTLAERTTFEVAATALVGLALGDQTDSFRPLFEDVIGGMMVPVPMRIPFGRLDRSLRARRALVRLLGPHVLRARSSPPTGLLGQLAHHREPDGQHLSVEDIVGHLVLLAWAGYDTTASSASWILHELAQRPDWQARLRAELAGADDAALENGARTPQLEAFLLEIERMYPSALFFPRVATRDAELLGHELPSGTLIFYSPYLSHRDPGVFDNPNAFDPERWTREARPSPARLFGFGGGFRVCLGKSFAKLQLRSMVRAFVERYDLQPDPLARPRIQGLPVHHPVGARIRFAPRRTVALAVAKEIPGMTTPLCEQLGMTFPLFAFTRSPEVVVAVSRAGGMGVQAAIGMSPEELTRCLEYIDKHVEGRPFGVDVVMPSGFVQPDGSKVRAGGDMASADDYHKAIPARHLQFLDELLARYGVPPLPAGATAALAMNEWTAQVSRKQVDIALQYPIRLIANALGPPPRDIIDLCHARGVKVAALVGSVEHARKQVQQGVDIIVAQGTEAGGHCGEISTMVLVPEVVDAVAPVPVIAAGGIGSGRQLAAALALGAQGGWAGSIWLTTVEGQTDSAVTRKLLAATSSDTVRSRAISGKPARQLKSTWSQAWDDPSTPDPLPMPLQFLLTAEAVARVHRHAETSGADDLVTSPVGQIVGSMNRLAPVAELLEELHAQFVATQRRIAGPWL